MFKREAGRFLFALVVFIPSLLWSQKEATTGTPIATQWTLDAAGTTQRSAITSVFLMVCPATEKKGTSFLLTTGVVITNAHVVSGCSESNLYALTPFGKRITFSKLVTDPVRDLAALRPNEKLQGGLELSEGGSPQLGAAVSTWGFPLIYNGPAPILSVGYVAGFNDVRADNKVVKHIVVNGAFNPGNSGGPVFAARSNKVIGIVVWKQMLFSQAVPTIIDGFKHPRGVRTYGEFTITEPDGTVRQASDQEAIAAVLEEFYATVQVVIGEAISVSELRQFLKEQQNNLN